MDVFKGSFHGKLTGSTNKKKTNVTHKYFLNSNYLLTVGTIYLSRVLAGVWGSILNVVNK